MNCPRVFLFFLLVCLTAIATGKDGNAPIALDEKAAEGDELHVTIRAGEATPAARLEKLLNALKVAGVTSVEIEDGAPKPGDLTDHPLLKKLDEIVIPAIEFVDTPLEDGLDFLRTRSREIDREADPKRKGVNVVILPPVGSESLTLQLDNATLGESLSVMAWMTGRQVSFTDNAVVLSPIGKAIVAGAIPLPPPDAKQTARTKEKLKAIVIPGIEFHETPLRDALDFLHHRGRELDTESAPADRGVDIAFRSPQFKGVSRDVPANNPPISLKLNNIPLGEALQFAVESARMKMEVRGNVVLISGK